MKKILFIESDKEKLAKISEMLVWANYTVTVAQTGREGIEKAISNTPDLILCSFEITDFDAYCTLKVYSQNPQINSVPFIFLAENISSEEFRNAINAGASDLLIAPFKEAEILSAIDSKLNFVDRIFKLKNTVEIDTYSSSQEFIRDFFKENNPISIRKGAAIYEEGQQGHFVYYLVKGEVKTFKYNEYGKEFITGINKEGDFFGFTSFAQNKVYHENAVALSSSKIHKIGKQELIEKFRQSPDLTIDFLEILADSLEQTKSHLIHIAYDSVRKKTADKLIELMDDSDGKEYIEISRNNLASLIGIAKETLIRTLSEFREEGSIKTSKKIITILDHNKLSKVK